MEAELRIRALERDSYKCQNRGCRYCEGPGTENSNLEVHHIIELFRFKEDLKLEQTLGYGPDSPKNLITLCSTCHRRYHCGAVVLHINGIDYETKTKERFGWKQFKKEMRQLRKEYRQDWGRRLTGEEIIILLYWLYVLSLRQ